eukprot:jgi/Botrbrau1/6790/Bobra.0057s0024.2
MSAKLTLGAFDNDGQVPRPTLEFISLQQPGVSVTHSTKDWKASEGGAYLSGSLPTLPQGFGEPGAVIISLPKANPLMQSLRPGSSPLKRFFLEDLELQMGKSTVKFTLQSFVDDVHGGRIFFNSAPFLPGKTPQAIEQLRITELRNKRGEDPATGKLLPAANEERKPGDRIYDYAPFNDLARPGLPRKVLMPYARRLRTGRKILPDGSEEPPAKNGKFWVPADEEFRKQKREQFDGDTKTGLLLVASTLVKEAFELAPTCEEFPSFEALYGMYNPSDSKKIPEAAPPPAASDRFPLDLRNSAVVNKVKSLVGVARNLGETIISKWPAPLVREFRDLNWLSDEEFGRQTLAGLNPSAIFRITPDSAFMKDTLFKAGQDRGALALPAPLEQLIKEGRLYGIDLDTGYRQFMGRVNSLKQNRHQYAGKALLFFTDDKTLVPVAIQLATTPKGADGPITTELYTPSRSLPEWNAAKLVFNSLDSGVHQLCTHHMRAHVCLEAFIIGVHRHISALHPVYKLLMPYFRFHLAINAEARGGLISAGNVIEKCWTPGEYAMQLTAFVYDALWTFEGQDIEVDLINRGMVKTGADEKPVRENGKLVPRIDFPYAEDGLDIYYAIRNYFTDYLSIYYSDTGANGKLKVTEDPEVTAWYAEVKEKGHPEKKVGWIELKDIASLARILTIIVWTASAHHSAVNYGQYDYSGWMPTRPSLIRKPIPTSGEELKELKDNFEGSVLKILSDPMTALQVMLVMKVLSVHDTDESYLTDNNIYLTAPEALEAEKKFHAALDKIESDIDARNAPGKSKIRSGDGVTTLPYTLLTPYLVPPKEPGYRTGQRGIAASVTV